MEFLVIQRDRVVAAFTAVDLVEARQKFLDKVTVDKVEYTLARKLKTVSLQQTVAMTIAEADV